MCDCDQGARASLRSQAGRVRRPSTESVSQHPPFSVGEPLRPQASVAALDSAGALGAGTHHRVPGRVGAGRGRPWLPAHRQVWRRVCRPKAARRRALHPGQPLRSAHQVSCVVEMMPQGGAMHSRRAWRPQHFGIHKEQWLLPIEASIRGDVM